MARGARGAEDPMRRMREDPRRIGAKRRREESAEFPEPPAAKEGSAKKVAATEAALGAEPRVSFLEEIQRFSGQVTVRTVDGLEREIPAEVAVASPGLQLLLERHDRRAASGAGRDLVLLRQPDCTADMLRRVEVSLRCVALPQDLDWPSEEAWSFLRCVAFLGVPVLLDAVARKAAQVLVDCMLEPTEDTVSGTFGQAPPGGLEDPVLEDTVGLAIAEEVQAYVRASRALGARAAEAASAALAEAEGSPLRGVGAPAVLRVLRAADEVMESREELVRLQEASTELEALAALRAVADARFLGCRIVVEAALRHLRALDSREILDQGLTVLEATLEPSDGPAASSLAEWLRSPCGMSAGWEARGRALSLLLLAAPQGHREATDVLVAASEAMDEEAGGEDALAGLREAAVAALPSVAPKGDSAALEAVAAWLLSASCEADRLKGLDALEQLADGTGPVAALCAVETCLMDENGEVRRSAVAALAALATRGDPDALDAARAGRASPNVAIRGTAVEALAAVAAWERAEGAVADLCALLSDPSPEVRDAALSALAGGAERGLKVVGRALMGLLEHKSWAVRARALVALGRAGDPGDEEVGRAIAGRLEDQMLGVRTEVPAALELLVGSERGNQAARKAAEAQLSNSRWAVRQAAAAALAKAAPRGDAQAEARLVELLRDGTASVREHALAALVELAVPGAEGPVAGILAAGADRDPSVRAAAQLAAARLLPRGCGAGVALAVRGLADACPPVRERAASALGSLAGDAEAAEAVEALAARLEDISDPVRRAVAASLLELVRAVGHSLTALAQVRRRCEHPSQAVRRVAEAACARLEGLCLQAGERERNDEELTPTPPQGPKVEPPAEGETPPKSEERACVDTVARGLSGFIVGLQSKDDAEVGDKQADPVTRGLEMFLAEQKKRVGPVCALQVSSGAPSLGPPGSRPPPTPGSAGSIFRPPLLEKEEEEGSVKEEVASELEPGSPRATARSETGTARSPSRYSASMTMTSPQPSRGRSRYSVSMTMTSPRPSRARSRSPRLPSSLPAETVEEDASRGALSASSAASEADGGSDEQEESEEEIGLSVSQAAASEAAASASEDLPDSGSEAGNSDSEAAPDASEAQSSSDSEAAPETSVALNSDSEAAPDASTAQNTDSEAGPEAGASTVAPRGTSRSTRSSSEAACSESRTARSESGAAPSTPQAGCEADFGQSQTARSESTAPPKPPQASRPGVHWVDLEPSDDD